MLFLSQEIPLNQTPTLEPKKIEEHNLYSPWKQSTNKFFDNTTLADVKEIINSSFASHSDIIRCSIDEFFPLLSRFDSREKWPNCLLPLANQKSILFYLHFRKLWIFICDRCYSIYSRKNLH